MNYKEIIKTKEYDFLRTEEDLKNIALLTLGGSHAYGTNNENSDLDVRGIALSSVNDFLGFTDFKRFKDESTDTTIYSSRRVLELLEKCNPEIIEMFRTKKEHILQISPIGQLFIDNINLFYSKDVIYDAFSRYAESQLHRIKNAENRVDNSSKLEHIRQSLEFQKQHFNKHYASLNGGYINIYIGKNQQNEDDILLDMNLKGYSLKAFNGIYSEMSNLLRNYDKLNHRNKKKSEKKIYKHKAHLVRLLEEGIELHETGDFSSFRDNSDELKQIINQQWEDEKFYAHVDALKEKLQYAYKHSVLPEKTDLNKITDFCLEVHSSIFKR